MKVGQEASSQLEDGGCVNWQDQRKVLHTKERMVPSFYGVVEDELAWERVGWSVPLSWQ